MQVRMRASEETSADLCNHAVPAADDMPLSQGQLSFLLAQMLDRADPAFNIGECVEILGPIDADKFELALREVVAATDALHLRVIETPNGPRQRFAYEPGWQFYRADFSAAADPDVAAQAWMRRDMSQAFALDAGPLYRFALLRLSATRYMWYAVNHHLINDGVGWRLLLTRVAEAYTGLVSGRPTVPQATGSWRDLLSEELTYRGSESARRDREFWLDTLRDLPPPASISGKRPTRPSGFLKSVGWLSREIDLDGVGRPHRATAPAVLAAATAIYTHRVTGAEDMAIGMPVGGRLGARMRTIVGMTANAIPLRIRISPRDRVCEIIERTARSIRVALRHQRYRYEDMRRDLGLSPRDSEIAGSNINYSPLDDDVRFGGAPILRNPLGNWWVEDFQIVFYGGNHPAGRRIDFIANPHNFDQRQLDFHRDRFIDLIAHISAAGAHQTIADLPETPILEPVHVVDLPQADERPNGHDDAPFIEPRTHGGSHIAPENGPPSTQTELAIATIWRDVLRTHSVLKHDDFFEAGGDSLLANILITRVRKAFEIELPLRALFDAPTLASLASLVDREVAKRQDEAAAPTIERIEQGSVAPLSFSQHRMWLIHSLDPGNTAYNMAGATRLVGPLDVGALSWAMDELRRRHEILRTTYAVDGIDVVQQVHPWKCEPISVLDLSTAADARAEADRLMRELARAPFDLSRLPLIRCVLVRLGPREHILHTAVHHIAGDQWSFGVLSRELGALYAAALDGRSLTLPDLPIRYRDYAQWQRRWLESPSMAAQLAYWREKLRGAPPLSLPTDRPRSRIQTLNGSICHVAIPTKLIEGLEQLSRQESATLFMTLFAAFATLLHRLANATDISIGVPIANRTDSVVENVVGSFVNTLVLRTDLSQDPSFTELLSRVKAIALDAFANQDIPFDRLVQEVVEVRDTSRSPLIQVLFNMVNAPMHGISLDGLDWELLHVDRGGAQFEISFTVDAQVTRTLIVEYNSDLFERATIERFSARYLHLLESLLAAPTTRLSALDLLPPAERRTLLEAWNNTSKPRPDKPFIALFEECAKRTPHAIAVSFEGTSLTYADLDARASSLARRLSQHGAGRGTAIGVCIERSLVMLVALLAVQKTGAAYVPLDPKLPAKRLEYMVTDSGISLLLTSGDVSALGAGAPPAHIVVIDAADVGSPEDESAADGSPPSQLPSLSDTAYILYTSGSTGQPKGVAISHLALTNFLGSMSKEPGLSSTDVLAAVTTISFDIAGLELFLPLLVGARIELVPSSVAGDGCALAELLLASGATVMQATPATWRMLVQSGWLGAPGFRALCGGEAMPRDLADALLERASEVWNLYGPTEATIWSTACRIERGEAPISIGRPIDNTRIYVLDGTTPAPIGVTGELCIGGDGVAIGYHARETVTKERFQPDPFVAGGRIYRTGDLGRWSWDGNLYHLGRMDHQVKVRGFRIELGEIEAVLDAHPDVVKSVVVVREIVSGDTRLVAYAVHRTAEPPTASEMRRYLRLSLPDYMIPALFVALDHLPLTPNGKIDRKALQDRFTGASAEPEQSRDVEQPASELETWLAALWRDALKVDHVGPDDNFFERGGHSLLAVRLVAEIEKQRGIRLDPRNLFFQSFRQIAAALVGSRDRAL